MSLTGLSSLQFILTCEISDIDISEIIIHIIQMMGKEKHLKVENSFIC